MAHQTMPLGHIGGCVEHLKIGVLRGQCEGYPHSLAHSGAWYGPGTIQHLDLSFRIYPADEMYPPRI